MAEEVVANDERLISPAALLGATAVSSSGLTTVGLTGGSTGAVVAGVAAVGAAVIALRRRGEPGTGGRPGLKKPGSKDRKKPGESKSPSGGLGRKGLLGGLGRKPKGAGATAGKRKRGAGLLGTTRKVAGKAAAAAKKKAGLLGDKRRTKAAAGRQNKGRGRGLLGRAKAAARRAAGAASKRRADRPPGKKRDRGSSKAKGGLFSRRGKNGGAAGAGSGKKGKGGPAQPAADKAKGEKDRKGPGLIGGGKTREDRAARRDKKGKKRDRGEQRGKRDEKAPALAAGTDRHGTTQRVHGGNTMPNPFDGRHEAVSSAAPLSIERANDLIDYVKHAPDYAEAQAKRWDQEANAIVEQINVTPEFAESLKDFAAAQLQQVQRVREFGETFRRTHAEKLSKLEQADPREEKWDIGRNRG